MSQYIYKQSALYAKHLSELAKQQSLIEHYVSTEENCTELEKRRKADLKNAYELIESQAKTGACRIYNWKKYYKTDMSILFDPEIKTYLMNNRFEYTSNSIEWCYAKEPRELK